MSWRSHIAFWKARRIGLVPPDTNPRPTITSASGTTTIVITGTNFMAVAPRPDAGTSFVESVYLGTVVADSFTVDSATQITAAGSWTGLDPIVVNTSGGCATALGTGSSRLTTGTGSELISSGGNNLRIP